MRSVVSQGSNDFLQAETETLIRLCECADVFESSLLVLLAGYQLNLFLYPFISAWLYSCQTCSS